jgi:uncharacterized MAPEG superfamily protein
MSKELFWLTLTTAMTGLFWLPYILDRIMVRGLMGAMANPSASDPPQSRWAERQMRAHTNAVENLVVFAPLVLTLNALGISTAATATACAVFFWARLAHYLVFTFGIPVVRTLSFAVGFAAQAVLVLTIFKLI